MNPIRLLAVGVASTLAFTGCASNADGASETSAAEFYDGKTVTLKVAFSPGGIYDLIARDLASALPKCFGDVDVRVEVENAPGAGGLSLANTLYNEKADGLTLGVFLHAGLVSAALADVQGVNFKVDEFSYIARLGDFTGMIAAGEETGISGPEELRAASNFKFGILGPGGADALDAVILDEVLGVNLETISGFPGNAEVLLAVASGEIDGASTTAENFATGPAATQPIVPILHIGEQRHEAFPEVPSMTELDIDQDATEIIDAYVTMRSGLGRSLLAPPNVPQDRVDLLRDAVECAMPTDEFVVRDELVQHGPGEDVKELTTDLLNAPEGFVSLLQKSYEG